MEAITENLRFMVNEVTTQVEQTFQFFAEPSRSMLVKIKARDAYVDTLKGHILDMSYTNLIASRDMDKNRINLLRAIITIATNLERIADFSVNMLRQTEYLTNIRFVNDFEVEIFFEEILFGLERIQSALNAREISQAFRICQCEFNLDEMYEEKFKLILSGLRSGGDTGNLITTLMILHYLERMGDSLLNIGEAIIFFLVGENLKIQQYTALKESLSASGLDTPLTSVEFESIWGTRSGCRIGVVGEKKDKDTARPVIFKHGKLNKISREKENIQKWEELMPGLPPQICGYVAGEEGDGSVLLEYLPGCTFQELSMGKHESVMRDALYMIEEIVGHVWRATMEQKPVSANFIEQIRDRMEVVYRLHPGFKNKPRRINTLKIRSFGELLRAMEKVGRDLTSPFSVFIHGDFNVNNIIYDPVDERIHFIDLHRSGRNDYVQDVSVFLVSLFRQPVFEQPVRARLNYAIMDFFEFAKNFALSQNDLTFEARLALGLARSFFTSTRFELNRRFARKMHMISVYLMEKLLEHKGRPWESFLLPGETLVY